MNFFLSVSILFRGLPRWCSGKEPAWQGRGCKDAGSIPGSGKVPRGRKRQSTLVFLPGEAGRQRSTLQAEEPGMLQS